MIKKIFAHNWIAIFYFNFRCLPIAQAWRLPFDFYHGVRFECLDGKVRINSASIRRGMIKFGGRGSEMFSRHITIVDIRGAVSFYGVAEIGHGALFRVNECGELIIGNNVRLGALSKVFCEERIVFGDEIDFSWECQIFDTNFHHVRDLATGEFEKLTSPVRIGSRNWFGNRVTVMKGTVTPDDTIIASNTLCNKDYMYLPRFSVIGGIPARVLRSAKQRLFENLEATPDWKKGVQSG